jgi:thiol-disulfide isomerase/thioredoxin
MIGKCVDRDPEVRYAGPEEDKPMNSHKWTGYLLLSILLVMAGCGGDRQPDNPYLGNMNDFSYSGQVTPDEIIYRISASGRDVSIAEFEGHFIWADYAGPWCQPCVNQAQAIKSLENNFGDRVVFLTVMTSKSPQYEDVPDRQTALAWAGRFGLDPDKVVVATNLWAWTVPTHILYSPEGHTLYRSTGYLPADQIASLLSTYIRDWERWERTGERADWMR